MTAARQSVFETLLLAYAKRFPLRRGKLRLVNSLWRLAAGGGDTRRLAQLKYGGFRLPCDVSEMLQRQFYFFGTYFVEEHILACWQAAAKEAGVVCDVGANAGIYSLSALAAAPTATVHAFEPTSEIAGRLREAANLNSLGRLYIHETAVSNENGYATLVRCRGDQGYNDGMNFIGSANTIGERVPAITLDTFCERNGIDRIDLLKLDIQGHEHVALGGATGLLRDGRLGTIFTELNWAAGTAACAASETVRILASAGYRFSQPGKQLDWRLAGDWLHALNDVVARRP